MHPCQLVRDFDAQRLSLSGQIDKSDASYLIESGYVLSPCSCDTWKGGPVGDTRALADESCTDSNPLCLDWDASWVVECASSSHGRLGDGRRRLV
jgi:hypothetical protein